ncbi:helix-turn-helix domain-containing protein [Nocardia callitridis]|uniref:HTH araC/xylS-type domain-containing protein n=1 Tax=Nocardia callitridis TaxID=648753 RepID=A0ABP9K7D7_9NOCA
MKALVTNGVSVAETEETAETAETSEADVAPSSISTTKDDSRRKQGCALLRPGVLAFDGAVPACGLHAHQAVQVILADTPLVVVDGSGERLTGRHLIIPTDSPHRITDGAALGLCLYLDPETALGAEADRRAHLHGWAHDMDESTGARSDAAPHRLRDRVAAVAADLFPAPPRTETVDHDAAVAATLRMLPALVADGVVRGSDVAQQLGVSTARLTHLFLDQVGMPLRRYIIWLRLQITTARVAEGEELGTAADAAGFAGSADLTRTFRRAFGLPPSALSAGRQWEFGGWAQTPLVEHHTTTFP